jgi:hypothetical protein
VPEHDPNVSEVHIIITTIELGHNFGKLYIHRVPENDAQAWLETVFNAVKNAKVTAAKRAFFQILTAAIIMCAFVLDMCEVSHEAQVPKLQI